MRIAWLQHVPFEGPGAIEAWASSREHVVSGHMAWKGDLPPRGSFDWLVVMGGPMSVHDEQAHPWLAAEKRVISEALDSSVRVLGVCLGAQLVADVMGAGVSRAPAREIGWFPVEFGPDADDLGLPGRLDAFHWHGDTFDVPDGAVPFASSPACANQAFSADNRRIVALQFHLESTPEGVEALLRECPSDYEEPGEWVQAPEQIAGTPDRFDSAHGALFDMMDALAP